MSLSLQFQNSKLCAHLYGLREESASLNNNSSSSLSASDETKNVDVSTEPKDKNQLSPNALNLSCCLNYARISDGNWHTVSLKRLGHDLLLQVDDGEAGKINLTSIDHQFNHHRKSEHRGTKFFEKVSRKSRILRRLTNPLPLEIDKQDGITIGGLPKYDGTTLVTVEHNFINSKSIYYINYYIYIYCVHALII